MDTGPRVCLPSHHRQAGPCGVGTRHGYAGRDRQCGSRVVSIFLTSPARPSSLVEARACRSDDQSYRSGVARWLAAERQAQRSLRRCGFFPCESGRSVPGTVIVALSRRSGMEGACADRLNRGPRRGTSATSRCRPGLATPCKRHQPRCRSHRDRRPFLPCDAIAAPAPCVTGHPIRHIKNHGLREAVPAINPTSYPVKRSDPQMPRLNWSVLVGGCHDIR